MNRTAAGLLTLLFAAACGAAAELAPLPAEGTRGPLEIAFSRDGSLAAVTEWDSGSVALLDAAGGALRRRFPTGGIHPAGVALTAGGEMAAAANSFSGSVSLIDTRSGAVRQIDLPGMPWDVEFSPGGGELYVSVSQLDQVAVVEVASGEVKARIPTGRRPRALSLSPDGTELAAACMTEGSVTFISIPDRRVTGHGPTPAVNLRGVALYPEGGRAYAVAQRAQNERPTRSAVGIWSNQAFEVRPNGGPNGARNIWLDLIGKDVADPDSVVLDIPRGRALVSCAGGDSLNALPLAGGSGPAATRLTRQPRGLALRPGGEEIWVAGHLSNEIVVLDAEALTVRRRIGLGPPEKPSVNLRGRYLFGSASLAQGGQFSCASCHPDGHTDGISWKFVHVADGLAEKGDRNVRSLRGGLAGAGPLRWTGYESEVEEFVKAELAGLFENRDLPAADVAALAAFAADRPLPPNPFRSAETAAARGRGEALFSGKAACSRCHGGPAAGGGIRAWVGTTARDLQLEVPHLRGVYDSYPYLHDGSAATLEAIFEKRNPEQAHGEAHRLTPAEMADLLAYIRAL